MIRIRSRRLAQVTAVTVALITLPSGPARAADPGPIATASSTVSIPGNNAQTALATGSDGSTGFVTARSGRGGTLAVIDLAGATVARSGPIPIAPQSLTLSTDGRLIVSGSGGGPVAIAPASGAVLARAKGIDTASPVAIGPLGKRIFTVDQMKGRAVALDARTLKTVRQTAICPSDFAGVGPGADDDGPTDTRVSITPDGRTLLVACLQNGLQFLDAKSVKRLGALPKAYGEGPVILTADGRRGYLIAGTRVASVDPVKRALIAAKDVYQPGDGRRDGVSEPPAGVLSADGRTLFIVWRSNGVLKAVDTGTLDATSVQVGGKAQWNANALALSPDGARVYVISDRDLVTVDAATRAVLGIDRAVPDGAYAEDVAVSGSKVVVSWTRMNDTPPNEAGVTILTMPS